MTVPPETADQSASAAPAPSGRAAVADESGATSRVLPDRASTEAAAARFATLRRRWWRQYAVALTAVAVLVVGGIALAWGTGEASHAHLHRAAQAAPNLIRTAPSNPLTEAWHSADHTALGKPLDGGTVITWSGHTVTGRDARTGKATWTYTRSDSRVCAAVQQQHLTLAVYARSRSCDQIDAFDTGTGKRAWQRTLDEQRVPLTGTPTITVTADTLFLQTSATIYAVTIPAGPCVPSTGLDCGSERWQYLAPDGCGIRSLMPGARGVLIALHCRSEDQLVFHDRYRGPDDNGYDPVLWTARNLTALPAAADSYIAAIDVSTGALLTFDTKSAKVIGRATLTPKPAVTAPPAFTTFGGVGVLRSGDRCYGLGADIVQQVWSVTCSAMPSADPGNSTQLLTTSGQGVVTLTGATGAVRSLDRGPIRGTPDAVVPAGSGYLLAGASTTMLH